MRIAAPAGRLWRKGSSERQEGFEGHRRRRNRAIDMPMRFASQACREKTELTLGLTGLRDHFPSSSLFSSTMVERGKPHPDLFLLAAESLGFDSKCIVVEDGVPGVATVRRAQT
jgi:beta-phosphoglucomutase-like phosphatase (HAD superfamily)